MKGKESTLVQGDLCYRGQRGESLLGTRNGQGLGSGGFRAGKVQSNLGGEKAQEKGEEEHTCRQESQTTVRTAKGGGNIDAMGHLKKMPQFVMQG